MRATGITLLLVAAIAVLVLVSLGRGLGGRFDSDDLEPVPVTRDATARAASQIGQRRTRAALGAPKVEHSQILFGDFHAHTTISFDAFMLNMPVIGGQGAAPLSDACDFARHCAALDFWSINDHAANITERDWRNTVEAIRRCDAAAGDPANPDMVSFLGWEWTQAGLTPETHFGHKNVVLRETGEGQVPTRPIAASLGGTATNAPSVWARGLMALSGPRFRDLAARWTALSEIEICEDAAVRDLPEDCREIAPTPADLFRKLDDWGLESIVIPHGTAWGTYTPPLSDWQKQLVGAMHDPDRQTLIEVYSGHGDSEVYRDWRSLGIAADGSLVCPEPSPGYLPVCWRVGEVIEARCLEEGTSARECSARAATARREAARAGVSPHVVAPGLGGAELALSGQCLDCDQPSFHYRPANSAQAIAALGDFGERDDRGAPRRFRMGFIASSDIHSARPGTGYKEDRALSETPKRDAESIDADGIVASFLMAGPEPASSRPRSLAEARETLTGLQLYETERVRSYLYTGGLVAVHAAGRDRDAIWEALEARRVYGTSGPRMLLYFDWLDEAGARPMGSEGTTRDAPVFRVRAAGSFEPQPGCDEATVAALGAERIERLCAGECYRPSERRRRVERIEIVRIRPQASPDEDLGPLIDDPWRVHVCDADEEAGCVATFVDEEFASAARDTLYYARAFEHPTPTVNGRQPACLERDGDRCLKVDLCEDDDECLSPYAHRAWSSPIWLDHPDAGQGG